LSLGHKFRNTNARKTIKVSVLASQGLCLMHLFNFQAKADILLCHQMHHWRMTLTFRDKWNRCTVQQTNSEAYLLNALLQW